jgi:amino acid adenylation domain-containing protein
MKPDFIQNHVLQAAQKFKGRIAVRHHGRELTYEELNAVSENVACDLLSLHGKTGAITGIYLNAGIDYVGAVIGTLRAGGIFFPINIKFPNHRLAETLRLTEPDLIITSEALESELRARLAHAGHSLKSALIYVVRDEVFSRKCPGFQEPSAAAGAGSNAPGGDACYLIATSGSTGEPKVILGSHYGLRHFIQWEIREFGLDEKTCGSFLSHPTFDVSLRDIFVPLCCGGTLAIPDEATKQDPVALYRWFEEGRISLTHIVPTLFRLLTQAVQSHNANGKALPALEWVLTAGEPLYGHDVFQWNQAVGEHAKLVNIYGPSETTLAKIFHRIQPSKLTAQQIVPLGKPIDGARVLVIDGNRLCNVGEEGQICIETKYRSKGYYRNPDLTRSVFVPNPVDPESPEPVYLTGDIGKWLEDGTLQFLGRKDAQIKLHGKRIELNEIEVALTQYPRVQLAAVALKSDDQGNQRLVAYIVSKEEGSLTVEPIRRFLLDRIADYMVPGIYVFSSVLPLTSSGKIDRRSLPDPVMIRPRLEQSYVGASNEVETRLVELWRQMLGFQQIGIDDNFFDLGGNSILAARLAVLIGEKFNRELPVVKVFEYPSIRLFANFLRNEDSGPTRLKNHDQRAQQRRSSRMMQRRARPLNR